jgi:hypothetical protein
MNVLIMDNNNDKKLSLCRKKLLFLHLQNALKIAVLYTIVISNREILL